MYKWTILTLALLLTACKQTAEKPPTNVETMTTSSPQVQADSSEVATIAVSLDGEGLRFIDTETGRASLLAFGISRLQAEEALERVAGPPNNRNTNRECGAGPIEFTRYGAMTLNFQDGKFAGWYLAKEPGSANYSTMAGISIGTSRDEAKLSVVVVDLQGSTLGHEFQIGSGANSIGGIFTDPSGAARITSLFAGVNCFFR